jgi:hypothetical protein
VQPSENGDHLLSMQLPPAFSIRQVPYPEIFILIIFCVMDIDSAKCLLYPQTAFGQQGAILGFPVPLTSRESNQGPASIPENALPSAQTLMCLTPQT